MDIAVLTPLWEKTLRKKCDLGEHALSEDERLWLLLREHIDDVEDNSIIGFYCGDGAANIEAIIAGWLSLGAEDMANIFERGTTLLDCYGLVQDDLAKEKLIEAWQDPECQKIFSDMDDDFDHALPKAEALLDQVAR
ncbi:MAG: hypothetical protein RR332_02020, partial [Clostridiales bacterium]